MLLGGGNAIMQRGWRLTETRVLTWLREDWCHWLHKKKKSAQHKCLLWHHTSIFQEECFSKNFERWSKQKEWRMHSMRQIKQPLLIILTTIIIVSFPFTLSMSGRLECKSAWNEFRDLAAKSLMAQQWPWLADTLQHSSDISIKLRTKEQKK